MDRLKQKRSSARAQNTKIINEATAMLQSDSADIATLIALKERLTSSNDKLKQISEEIEDHIPKDDLASEYAAAADYEDQAVATPARLQRRIEDINNAQKAVFLNIGPRLPRFKIKPFNGNIREWRAFWEQFDGTVHSNETLRRTSSITSEMS
ncbi:hypothetical protein HPB50_025540 [Hyalomma asiaticum]|uniref:Uncharacterized protein n=1 Tax=Hyalomma asiaticum TaxID=266040 RepID=A0ACB7RTV5_HYAAI|nr:hypothetical protein HPB50_025540 [Hyalomma asiaticum]